MPLEWTVSNPDIGHIEGSAGVTAIYVGHGKLGTNAIVVKDRGKAEGAAVVDHSEPVAAAAAANGD